MKELLGKKGLTILNVQFPLYGYMSKGTEFYLWTGTADAISIYKDKYVIVDWKDVQGLLGYWDSSTAFGAHLHQCLIYAKLLALHLELPYMPPIMIVPIDGITGQDVHPGLFKDHSRECVDALNDFTWSIKHPQPMLRYL